MSNSDSASSNDWLSGPLTMPNTPIVRAHSFVSFNRMPAVPTISMQQRQVLCTNIADK